MDAGQVSEAMTAGATKAGPKPRFDIIQKETPEAQGHAAACSERMLADQYAGTKHSCYGDESGAFQHAEFEHMYY